MLLVYFLSAMSFYLSTLASDGCMCVCECVLPSDETPEVQLLGGHSWSLEQSPTWVLRDPYPCSLPESYEDLPSKEVKVMLQGWLVWCRSILLFLAMLFMDCRELPRIIVWDKSKQASIATLSKQLLQDIMAITKLDN